MMGNKPFDIEIDKLTRSIENAVSGDSFKTEVLELTLADIRKLRKVDWLFEWKAEAKQVVKRFISLLLMTIQTLFKGNKPARPGRSYVYGIIESNKFNREAKKVYLGVPGNLVSIACKISFDKGYRGYVSFESKTKLKEHYQKTLGAHLLFGNFMTIDTIAAAKLVDQYFPENS